MRKKYLVLFILLLSAFAYLGTARAGFFLNEGKVTIHEKQGIMVKPISVIVPPLQAKWFPISLEHHGDRYTEEYEIEVEVRGTIPEIGAYICDDRNLKFLTKKMEFECLGLAKGLSKFTITGTKYSTNPHYFVLNNGFERKYSKEIKARLYITKKLSKDQQKELRLYFNKIVQWLREYFEPEDYNITLAPCRDENLFPDVEGNHLKLCSELFYDAYIENNKGAAINILMHKLGHVMLESWRHPHFMDEKAADEFAVAVMLTLPDNIGEQYLKDWLSWRKNNAFLKTELSDKLDQKRHLLTETRALSIEDIVRNRYSFLKDWADALYPRMTNRTLEDITTYPYTGADVDLAKKILKEREDEKAALRKKNKKMY